MNVIGTRVMGLLCAHRDPMINTVEDIYIEWLGMSPFMVGRTGFAVCGLSRFIALLSSSSLQGVKGYSGEKVFCWDWQEYIYLTFVSKGRIS